MLEFIIIAVLFLSVLVLAFNRLYSGSKHRTTIPGLSPSSKGDGNLGDLARAGSLHQFLVESHARFGPITGFWLGPTYHVSIASPELFKQHSNAFDRPYDLYKFLEPVFRPRSIAYANGSDARGRRKTYDKIFAHERRSNYLTYFEKLAQDVETRWLEKGEDDHIAVSEYSFVYVLRGALVTMMGDHFKDDKAFLHFKASYHKCWDALEYALMHPNDIQDEKAKEEFDKDLLFLHSSIKKVISERRKGDQHLQGNLLIDMLIETCPDEDTLEADAITYLIAGFHTTGNLLTWAVYFLATHKDVQTKLYEEIMSAIGAKGSVDEHNFSEFVYMTQVIDETLRCAVIAPYAARYQDVDIELGGHNIPKNTPVVQALGVLLQDENVWPEPNKFDPDRFSPDNRGKMSTFDFVPFGFAGKRKCPGYRFTYWDAVVFLATLVRRFEINMWGDQVVTPVYGLVSHPDDEIWVKVTKRT